MVNHVNGQSALWTCQPVLFVWTGKVKGEAFYGGLLKVRGGPYRFTQVATPRFGGKLSLKALGNRAQYVPVPLVLLGDGKDDAAVRCSVSLNGFKDDDLTQGELSAVVGSDNDLYPMPEPVRLRVLPPLCLVEAAITLADAGREESVAEIKPHAVLLRRESAEGLSFIPIAVPLPASKVTLPSISVQELKPLPEAPAEDEED